MQARTCLFAVCVAALTSASAWGQTTAVDLSPPTAAVAPPVARFASLSADRIRALVPPPALEGSDAQLAELAEVLRLQAQVTAADIQRAADDVQRAPVAWVQWLLGDSFAASKHPKGFGGEIF